MKIMRPNTFHLADPNHKRWTEDLYKLTNKNISFGQTVQYKDNVQVSPNLDQNLNGVSCEISDTGLANTQFAVMHNLGRIPNFYDVKYINLNGGIYDSGTAWTITQIFLKCSAAHAKVRLFIH